MKVLLFANTDWYLYNFRRDLALGLRDRGDEVILLSPPGEYANRLQELGFRWLSIGLSRRSMNPLRELGTIVRLAQIYRREKPDLVHHFTVKCVLYGTLAARWVGVKAIINSITGLGYIFLPGGPWKRVLRSFVYLWYRLILRGTQVIFENDEDRQSFIRNGFIQLQDDNLIPGVGVDTTRFKLSPLPAGVPIVLMATRLLWDKGVGEFVEVAHQLHSEGIKARFILAGRTDPGNPASISEAQVETWRSEGHIEWLGWIENMATVLEQSSIICLPSYREGLPTVLIEAGACGRPVVATDVPGCRLAVQDGVTGLLVSERDIKSLADALRRLLSNPVICQDMGSAGRRRVEEMFSSERILVQILEVYVKAAAKGGRFG
jgi:glycosyltransferase involved in cell wall biosynthesis